MSFLPEKTTLGRLEIIEVYSFYDYPVLFSCRNISGHIFVAVLIDSLEDTDVWMYAPVSSSRFQDFRQGRFELRDVFTNSEDSFVYRVKTPYNSELNAVITIIYSNEISDEDLPYAGQLIHINDEHESEYIERLSKEKRKEILDFVLQFPQEEVTAAPIGDLGLVLTSLQETLNAIGQIKLGKAESHIIQAEVVQKTLVSLSGVFKGSFGMRLEGVSYEEDYLGESLLGQCINEFIGLINLGSNETELQAKLSSLKKKTASKYINFLNSLTKIGISKLRVDWATPNRQGTQSGEIGLETIIQTLKAIKNVRLETETSIVVYVNLIAISFEGKKITLKDINNGKSYKCTINNSAIKDVETIHSTATYIATIREYITSIPVVESEQHKYELLSLKISEEQVPLSQ